MKSLFFLAVAVFFAAVGAKSLVLPPEPPIVPAAWAAFPIATLWVMVAWLSWRR